MTGLGSGPCPAGRRKNGGVTSDKVQPVNSRGEFEFVSLRQCNPMAGVDKIGAGPKGIRIDKITVKNLELKILELVNNSSFKKKAEKVASQMEKESFNEELYNSIVE